MSEGLEVNNMRTENQSPVAPPRRQRNSERQRQEYLTQTETECGRNGHPDATMILIAYRHGLRVIELCALVREQVDFGQVCYTSTAANTGAVGASAWLPGDPRTAASQMGTGAGRGAHHVSLTKRGAPMTTNGSRNMVACIPNPFIQ